MSQIILAIDTSAAHCAVALLWTDTGRTLSRSVDMAKGQAEFLLPMIEDLLEKAALTWPNITKIAVGTGPGNFTGIRISVALARGLSLGLGVPAVGITGFVARAHDVSTDDFWVSIPAPRDQIYVQRFGPDTSSQTDPARMLPSAEFDPQGAPVLHLGDLPAANLALAIAQAAAQISAAPRPAPFYLRAADALPPSDPPPVILP